MLGNYCKIINIEGLTMVDMVKKDILPAVSAYVKELAETGNAKKTFCPGVDCSYEETLVFRLSELCGVVCKQVMTLSDKLADAKKSTDVLSAANYFKDVIIPEMNAIRSNVDEMETITDAKHWPYPSYGDLLFSVH